MSCRIVAVKTQYTNEEISCGSDKTANCDWPLEKRKVSQDHEAAAARTPRHLPPRYKIHILTSPRQLFNFNEIHLSFALLPSVSLLRFWISAKYF